jgi:class 3 adenylate cyclase
MVKTQAVTIMFCDLVSSTERRARLGDDAYDDFNQMLFVALRASIGAFGGREVSNAGDGMMVVFSESVVDAVACAGEMHAKAAALDLIDTPLLRIGISCGEVAQDGDNYSGMPIVEAARLEAKAAPGQTLANAVVRTLVGTRRALRFRDVGKLALKGIPEPLAAVEVLHSDVADVPEQTGPPARPQGRRSAAIVVVAAAVALAAIVAVIVIAKPFSHTAARTTHAALVANYPVSYASKACPPDLASQIAGLTCATLTVPEDRSKPHGRTVKLDVFHAPARGHSSTGPTVDFGADDLASSPARDHGDEYVLAQRGYAAHDTPSSVPALRCPEYSRIAGDALTKPSGDKSEVQREVDAFHRCYERLTAGGSDLNQYNYLTAGDDMVDLIRKLHLQHVNIVSGYVATISAFQVIRTLPEVVRSLTLQEPVPAGRSMYTDPTRYLANAFEKYVELCHADPGCKASYPNLATDLRRDYNLYRTHPRVVHGDDGNGHKHDVLIDGPRVAEAVSGALFDSNDLAVLAAGIAAYPRTPAIDELTAGRIDFYNALELDPTFAWGASMANNCSYDQYTIDPSHVLSSNATPDLSGVDNNLLQRLCSGWPVHKLPNIAFDDQTSNVPTLIVTGALAPATDQDWADQFQSKLPNATVATFPTLSALVLNANNPECLAGLRRQFLDQPDATLNAESCTRYSPSIAFAAAP